MPHTSHLQERSPTSIALLFLQSRFECTLRVGVHRVLAARDRRIFEELYFACAATSRVPPAFDREWFHHLVNGSQLHAFSQDHAFLCFVVHAHSIGDRRTETSSCGRKKKKKKKKKHQWHSSDGTASAFRKRLAFLALSWSVTGESTDSWAREWRRKFFGGSAYCIERCLRSRGSLLLRLDEGQLTSASWAHLTVESYGRIVKDSHCSSKEYLRRKKRQSKREKKPSFLNVIISTDIVTSNPSLFAYFLFFFFLPLFLFSSSPACYAPYFSCTGTQPDKYCFTFSAILFEWHCVLACIACWPLAIGGSLKNSRLS